MLGSLRWMLNIYFLKRDSMSQRLKKSHGQAFDCTQSVQNIFWRTYRFRMMYGQEVVFWSFCLTFCVHFGLKPRPRFDLDLFSSTCFGMCFCLESHVVVCFFPMKMVLLKSSEKKTGEKTDRNFTTTVPYDLIRTYQIYHLSKIPVVLHLKELIWEMYPIRYMYIYMVN